MDQQFSEQEQMTSGNFCSELEIFKTAVTKAPFAISICDEKNNHIFQNPSFFELFGYELENLKDKTLKMLYADPHMHESAMAAFFSNQSWSAQTEIIHRNGSSVSVKISTEIIADSQGHIVGSISYFTDRRVQEQKEHELWCQKEYLSTLHSISLGMFRRIDLSELLNAIVLKVAKTTGVPNIFLYLYDHKHHVLELKAGCGSMADFIGAGVQPGSGIVGRIFEKGEPVVFDHLDPQHKTLTDSFFSPYSAVMGIPLISGSTIKGVIGVCHDFRGAKLFPDTMGILEEFAAIANIAIDSAHLVEGQKAELEKRLSLEKKNKESQIRLYQSQRMDAIGTLAAGIAHDFNNILSSIMGFTQVAQSEAQKESPLASDLNEIYTASLRAKDLVQQILAFARQSNDQVNAIKISLIVKEVLKFIRSSIPATIKIEHSIAAKGKVLANPAQIYQIFMNLFTNAAQAMEKDGGVLSVKLMEETLEKPMGDILPGQYIKACVSDTGVGIQEDQLHSIFEPYFTTRAAGDGTGLGLSVVHGVVKSMGGEIFVESTPGQGTAFILYFPLVQQTELAEGNQFKKNPISVPGKGEHVLFVDDEPAIADVGKRLLEKQNYKVTSFTSSQQALAAFLAAPGDFHVVVTDMTMPEMTGEKLARELKKIRSDIPVILCSGHQNYASKQELQDRNLDYICSKPISKDELAMTVRKAIDGIASE
ncbi:MAG: response regulator [Proteobacteria bacterium]|nr:response regulator [Pseudomonadota bacterium]MBU1388080.1 response regulator [Pseudomonadota bacterium]MBU1542143.1 response regulator [Pseudomonadota bacterium]MBU2481169.1 response regulator [Pseudomonadota bacterium]